MSLFSIPFTVMTQPSSSSAMGYSAVNFMQVLMKIFTSAANIRAQIMGRMCFLLIAVTSLFQHLAKKVIIEPSEGLPVMLVFHGIHPLVCKKIYLLCR